MTTNRRTRAFLAVAVLVFAFPTVRALAQSSDPEAEREGIRRRQVDLAAQLDVLRATDAQISDALTSLNQNVSNQIDLVAAARQAAAAALDAQTAAETRAEQAQRTVDELHERLRDLAVGLYVRPPTDDMVNAVVNATPNDAPVRFALARFRVEDVTTVLEQSKQAKAQLDVARRLAVDARIEADTRALAAKTRLEELEAARAQQQAFADQVGERIEQTLGEVGQLQQLDVELTAQIQRQQLDLAAKLAAQRAPAGPTNPPPPAGPGGGLAVPATASPAVVTLANTPVASVPTPPVPPVTLVGPHTTDAPSNAPATTSAPPTTAAPPPTTTPHRVVSVTPVNTTWVGGIEVATSISGQLAALLDAARAAGITLTGSGYRNILDQIEIRRQVCGPTDYDIWDKPSWECSPPVARPGYSMHEKGLAVDFTGSNGDLIRTQDSPAFKWLAANAARFGFYNLPSEPWHWSINGH